MVRDEEDESPQAAGDGVKGFVAKGFERVRDLLEALVRDDPEYSGQVCAYWKGEVVVDLVGGPGLDDDAITGVHSSSKGVAGLVIALLVQEGALDPDRYVADYWPEFAAEGKHEVTVRQLLTHQAGLPGIDGGFTIDEYVDSSRAAARLAAIRPYWRPGTAFGYHARTLGVFMEELVRRVEGATLQEVYARRIRDLYGIDFYLGLPPEQEHRYRDVLPASRLTQARTSVPAGATVPGGLASLTQDADFDSVDPVNIPRLRAAGLCSSAGAGSARGLAHVYAAASTGMDGGAPFLAPRTIAEVAQEQVWGVDRVLGGRKAFALVFMKPSPENAFGSHRAFGHDGAAGSLGFADPLHELAFGYVPRRHGPGGTAGAGTRLAREVITAIVGHAA